MQSKNSLLSVAEEVNGNIKENKNKMSSPKVSVGDLPLSYTYEEDSRQQISGMTLNLMGFTLIELLVVVLIIGILAAVALPQYRLAVAKSRYASLKAVVDKITQAQEVYYLVNGKYSNRFEELDVDLPAGGEPDTTSLNRYNYDWGFCFTGYSGEIARTTCYNTKIGLGYSHRPSHLPTGAKPGLRKCTVRSTDVSDWRNQVCKQETKAANGSVVESYIEWTYQ